MIRLAHLIITISVPILLTLLSVRLVMTPLFLQFEYNRPGFPDDIYGLTKAERLEYAPYALDYLINGEPISYLAELEFPNGTPLFNGREMRHMQDVQTVTQMAFALLIANGITFVAISTWLWHKQRLFQAIRDGSLLTLSMIGAIVVVAVVAWDTFFTSFHRLFFESGTWRFAYSDTLIRLFPEQFWFDAALMIGGLTGLEALLLLVMGLRGTNLTQS
jgi:integral membrane protein (TIGR01906 family)